MTLYYCNKCGAFVDKRQMAKHVKKCGNRRFTIYRWRR
jgi:hypothetical protein